MPDNDSKISLEQVETAREPANAELIDEAAGRENDEFGRRRENDRRNFFCASILIALLVCTVFYISFLFWVFSENTQNWHIGLMLLLPPTTIILTLIPLLRYKAPNQYGNEEALNPLIEQVKRIVDILKPFKDLFKGD